MGVSLELKLYPRYQENPSSDWILSIASIKEGPVTIEGVTYSDELQALVEAVKSQIKNPIFLQLDMDLEYRLAKMRG